MHPPCHAACAAQNDMTPGVSSTTQQQLDSLRGILRELGSVLVCYSGGIDSAFVLAVAHAELGERAIGMTAVSPSLSEGEKEDAARIAQKLGADHRFVESHELERPGYVQNGPDRCFHCKSELYEIGRPNAVNGSSPSSSTAPIATTSVTTVPGSKRRKMPARAVLSWKRA